MEQMELSSGAIIWSAIGSFSALLISAALNHSFWWGVLHFFLAWIYVLYALICRSHEIIPALSSMFS